LLLHITHSSKVNCTLDKVNCTLCVRKHTILGPDLELWCLLISFQRTHYCTPKIQDSGDPPSWKSTWCHFFCRGWSDLDKISQTGAEYHVDCMSSQSHLPHCMCCHVVNSMSWSQSYVSHCSVLPPGEFIDMSFQSHVSRCRVGLQPLGEFMHCHDSRATCRIAGCSHLAKSMSWSCHIAGCKNSIHHIESRFSPHFIYLYFLNAVWALTSGGCLIDSDTLVYV